ncbi:MAG: creatininase family protein [Desulfobacterales bacterium]|nr:MAG: creatininase family protein [Desulfobacterales bacterium]
MLLENLAYPEVEDYLKEKDIILIPIGSVEQHSPYGLMGTDFIAAESIARSVGDSMGILVAPTLAYGVSPHHMAFKGTITLNPSTLIEVISDIVRSLITHEFKRIIFINGHGGNINTLKTTFQRLKAEKLPGYIDVISWYDSSAVRQICQDIFGDGEGRHATPGEVSITKYLRPSEFAAKASDEATLNKPKYYWPLSSVEMKTVFPDGRMESAPWLATEEFGGRIAAVAVAGLEKKLTEIMNLELVNASAG